MLATTHKFESGYLYGLTGTRDGKTEPVFAERSPLAQVHRITTPVILFQGLEDKVVPPDQSRSMVEALKTNGVPVAYLELPGEGHGFRQADTIRDVLLAEYAFYCAILGFHPAERLPDLHIWNWI